MVLKSRDFDMSTNVRNFPISCTDNRSPHSRIPSAQFLEVLIVGEKFNSYLTGRDELQGAKGGLQVLSVALEVEQSTGNRGLQLGGVLPGGRVGGNLVDGSHDCERRSAAKVLG